MIIYDRGWDLDRKITLEILKRAIKPSAIFNQTTRKQ